MRNMLEVNRVFYSFTSLKSLQQIVFYPLIKGDFNGFFMRSSILPPEIILQYLPVIECDFIGQVVFHKNPGLSCVVRSHWYS